MNPVEKGLRTTLIGIAINLSLAIVKAVAGVLGHSYALVADAIESTSDIFSSLIVYVGLRYAARPRDQNHPYGHGKAEPIASILVTLALFAAAFTIIVQSIREIITPHHAPAPFTLLVLIGVVVTKEALFRMVNKVGQEIGSTAVKTDSWHHRSDAITSAAVFLGIVIALIGGPGWESADDYAALLASTVIIINAVILFIPALHEIMDARPPGDIEEKIRALAGTVEGVARIEKCLIRKAGLSYIVDIHAWVNGALSVREGHAISHRIKEVLVQSPHQVLDVNVHIEPAAP